MTKPVRLSIDQIEGNCPVQVIGSINGYYFYFRARGEHWRIEIGEGAREPGVPLWEYSEMYKEGETNAAGWMTSEEAKRFITKGAEMFNMIQGAKP